MKDPWTIILPVLWAEFDRAVEKHPEFPGGQAAVAIIAEELGELAKELNDMLKAAGYEAHCYDVYGRCDGIPGKADVLTAVEVFEHVMHPQVLWHNLRRMLNKGGLLMATTETCDGIEDIGEWFYANPRAGHAVIYSAKALDMMAESYHFRKVCQLDNIYVWRAE